MKIIHNIIIVSSVLMASLATNVQADWVVQAAASDRIDLLEAQSQKMQRQFQHVRIIYVDGAAKLVVGQWRTTREANATLVAVQQSIPGAFLRKVDSDSAQQPRYVSAPAVATPKPQTPAATPVFSVPANQAAVYDPNLWIKR